MLTKVKNDINVGNYVEVNDLLKEYMTSEGFDNLSQNLKIDIIYYRSITLLNMEKYDEAIAVAERILSIDKNNLKIDEKNNLFGLIGTLKEEDFKSLLIEAINPVGYNMIVTPKEIDFVIDRLANVISTGINNALHDKVTHLKV